MPTMPRVPEIKIVNFDSEDREDVSTEARAVDEEIPNVSSSLESTAAAMAGMSFTLQSGVRRATVQWPTADISLRDLRAEAVKFINTHYPEHQLGEDFSDRLLIYRHDQRSVNILELIVSSAEITDGSLLEAVVSPCPNQERLVVHPHSLFQTNLFPTVSSTGTTGLSDSGADCQSSYSRSVVTTPSGVSAQQSILAAPEIFVEQTDDGDPIGGNHLQQPRKDRSSSWSGRPLWMEIAEASRVKIPHTFQVHTYKRPTVCQHCKKLLRGLIRQGIQCRECKFNCHKKCERYVAKDCPGNVESVLPGHVLGTSDERSTDDETVGSFRTMTSFSSCDVDEEDEDEERDSLAALDHSARDADLPTSPQRTHKRTQATPSAPLHATENTDRRSVSPPNGDEEEVEPTNIPLQRIVMSKKQTKRQSNKAIREGWLTHYTDRSSMRKKHYWRLDTKSIVLYKDETSSGYYKATELPLSEILDVKAVAHQDLKKQLTHFMEIKTQGATYFIAGASTENQTQNEKTTTDNAANWAQAIKQALMPVTPQSSTPVGERTIEMVQLNVPPTDEIGQLGQKIQSEQEFSQIYQIFAEDILGSGQFGVVYGGGSFLLIAPEVLRSKGFNRLLDMWSVGVIVYVSLSGTFPFNEDEDLESQIKNADFMYPKDPWGEVSADAIDFINNLLQVKMAKRLSVAKALCHTWLQGYELWSDLRTLERDVGERFVTHESDDARWQEYERANGITPVYTTAAAAPPTSS
ncbi:Serine/threonine-protein kinase D [Aphelenchoides fujianensis]|nr:Serine/threonine-protein kinase D [Aphelenchoides fujianensis]